MELDDDDLALLGYSRDLDPRDALRGYSVRAVASAWKPAPKGALRVWRDYYHRSVVKPGFRAVRRASALASYHARKHLKKRKSYYVPVKERRHAARD